MIRRIKRALGIRFSSKALIRNPAINVHQIIGGFREFPELSAEFLERETANVLQVGANDGASNDPLSRILLQYRSRVRMAVLIEPQTGAFDRLTARYRDWDQVICLNTAIGREVGKQTLYSVDPVAVSSLRKPAGDGIASFDRRHVEAHLQACDRTLSQEALRRMITRSVVPVTTLELAAAKGGMDQPDILLVDTEGFDGQVVGMALDLGWRPTLLQWEHKHLARSEQRRLTRRLTGEGYRLWADHSDTWGQRAQDSTQANPTLSDTVSAGHVAICVTLCGR